MSKVKFGLTLSNRGVLLGITTADELLELAEMADASGAFDQVWVGDSIMAKPRMESMVLMSALAARTKNVRIGPACMASFPSRHPVLLAYQWASLDLLSGGRTILSVCMGAADHLYGQKVEYNNMGITSKDRARRMEENIDILRKLWSEDKVSFQGEFYTLEEAFVEPRPVQNPPPIWVTSNPTNPRVGSQKPHIIERAMRRVARMGDGWMTTGTTPEDFANLRGQIVGYAPEYGRNFEELPACLYYNINVNEDKEAAYQESKRYLDQYYSTDFKRDYLENWVAHGSPEQCSEQIQGFIDAGATDITLRLTSGDQKAQFKRCVEEVLPSFL